MERAEGKTMRKPCGDKCVEDCDYPYCGVTRRKEENEMLKKEKQL